MPEKVLVPVSNPAWEMIFREKEWGKYPPEHVIRFVARNFYRAANRKDVQLLEIGCGPGANVWFMAREGFSVSGIDGSSTAIKKAGERLATESLAADLYVGDFGQLPWRNDSFDGVIENVSLYTNPWKNIVSALLEVKRVLKPGGVFLSSFFTDRTWGYGAGEMSEIDGFKAVSEGPLAGTGFCLFLKRERISELFSAFSDVAFERTSTTANGEQYLIEQFVITCRKPETGIRS